MPPLRFTPLILACCWVLPNMAPGLAFGQEDLSFEPYTVYVVETSGHARCGPSEDYYRTDPLRHGQALEVYAETDDGWLGIRPPEDSFCWVQAETIDLDEATDAGVVTEDRTVAWIGTHLGRARSYRWQVQLAEGEEVTVIGRSERDGPDGPQLWYRIVPPSGEYRWVHRDQVVDSSEQLVELLEQAKQQAIQLAAAKAKSSPNVPGTPILGGKDPYVERRAGSAGGSLAQNQTPATEPTDPSWESNDTRLSVDHAAAAHQQVGAVQDATANTVVNATFIGRPKLLEIGTAPAAPQRNVAAGDANWVTGTTARIATTGTAIAALANPIAQVAGYQPLPAQTLTPAAAASTKPVRIVPAQRIAQIEAEVSGAGIERLDLVFSRLMAAQATAAEMEPLAHAARTLASSSDQAVAGRARMLAERADQYRRIANQRDGRAVVGQAGGTEIPAASLSTLPTSLPLPAAASSAAIGQAAAVETNFTGTLVQVYSARSSSPPFALIDDAGRTLAYVTPTPGTNLRVHLNSKIRVSGTQGYLTGLNTPHVVTASAVRVAE